VISSKFEMIIRSTAASGGYIQMIGRLERYYAVV
jgi:hypothetical protein